MFTFQSLKLSITAFALFFCCTAVPAQSPTPDPAIQFGLNVDADVPLRVYITKRLNMRAGEPVTAILIEPIYSFDRVVIPAGANLQGHVTGFNPVPKMVRAKALMGGDFSPLHFARVEFTNVTLPDGRAIPIQTFDSAGLPTLYVAPRPSNKTKPLPTGVIATAKQQIREQIVTRSQDVIEVVRGHNKKEFIEDLVIKKLPYHPQWYRRNTRFDAVLRQPVGLGITAAPADTLRHIGLPASDLVAQVRLITPLSSADASVQAKVEGVISRPVFSATNQLILPEGTRLTGRVRRAQPARYFHRGGQLRFTFDSIEPPAWTALPPIPLERKEIQLAKAEADPTAHIQIDSEGNAKSTEPKTRLLGPILALVIAGSSSDNDSDRTRTGTSTNNGNRAGRALGGLSGFGLLGSGAAQLSKTAGTALGYYGLAWSVYSNIISRGREVEFAKNAAIEVRFGSQPAPPASARSRFWGVFNR